MALSELEYERQQKLAGSGAVALQDFDRAKSTRDQNRQRVDQLKADLETARLGSRSDQIQAAADNVAALEAALAGSEVESLAEESGRTQGGPGL